MDHGDIRKLSSFIVAEQSSSHESSVETEASLGCPLCLGAPGEIQVSDQDGGVVPEEVDHRSCRFCAVWATEGDRLARLLFALLGFRGQVCFCSGSPSAGDSVPAQCGMGGGFVDPGALLLPVVASAAVEPVRFGVVVWVAVVESSDRLSEVSFGARLGNFGCSLWSGFFS